MCNLIGEQLLFVSVVLVYALFPHTNCMELTKEILTFDSNTHQYCKSKVIPEEWLFPIRNQQGLDEMIKITGYPPIRSRE